MNVAKRLREARENAGYTQEALAKKAGVTRSQIANIECGNCEPSFHLAQRLMRLFGNELFTPRARKRKRCA